MSISAKRYALNELKAERFPEIGILDGAGMFYLTDRDGHLLADRGVATREAAYAARSKALEQANRLHWR